MKKFSILFSFLLPIILLASIMLAVACSRQSAKEPTATTDHSSSLSLESVGEMSRNGIPAERYMAAQDSLVMLMRRGLTKDNPVDILSQSGYFHLRRGEYLKGLEYLHEASDSLSKEKNAETLRGKISLPGNLSGLFYRFGLYDDALEQNAKAMEISRLNGNLAMSDLLRMRGSIYADMHKNNPEHPKALADSALACHDKAVAAARSVPEKDLCETIRAEFFVMHPDFAPDSLPGAITTLRRIAESESEDAATASAILGKALTDKGDCTAGIKYLEKALGEFRRIQEEESEEWALGLLVESYMKAGRYDLLKSIYPHYSAMRDSTINNDKINAIIGAEYRYRVKDKERELHAMEERHNLARNTMLFQRIALILALALIITIVTIAMRLLRKSEKAKTEAISRIESILGHQQELNARIESLNREIADLESHRTIENIARQLSPSVLRDNDEKEFRQAFATLHPNFLRNLRHDYPDLTDNDELVCMLILLRFNSDEIAMCLGISRQSVISIRHRIRKKMKLEKSDDLDSLITSRT